MSAQLRQSFDGLYGVLQGWVRPSEVGGFKKGDRVQWTGSNDDIPEGTVGTVMKFEGDGDVRVAFPNGTWGFAPDQLRAEVNA